MNTYLFVGPDVRSFKLAVRAVSLASARRYVAQAASRAHRELRYVGQGEPSNPAGWCGAVARCGLTGKDY